MFIDNETSPCRASKVSAPRQSLLVIPVSSVVPANTEPLKVKQELDHNKVVCLVPKGSCTRHRCRRRGHLQFCRRCTTSKSAFHSRWTAGHFASFRENPRMSLDPVFYGISAIHGRIAGSSTPAILKSSSRCQLMGWACLAEDLGACAAHFGIFRPIVLRPEVCLLCG